MIRILNTLLTSLILIGAAQANGLQRADNATIDGTVTSVKGGMIHLVMANGDDAIVYTTRSIGGQFKPGQQIRAQGRLSEGDWLGIANTELTSLEVSLQE